MNIQESQQIKRTAEAALAMIQALAAQMDRLEKRLEEIEQKRGPGRPRGVENEAVRN
jgi:ubiquinone biosynthesis protein UbiJ